MILVSDANVYSNHNSRCNEFLERSSATKPLDAKLERLEA